ncbi:MAG: Eco57I restriction-modification methylase domain-containing protein [Phascolarctobacterium sp.]|nr:Eco57I restriction-modification methylase domain-containing protein [Phascolarctobacterium sp.]
MQEVNQNTVDIKENLIIEQHPELLELLLKDCTTKRNIIWATDDYSELGIGYSASDEIKIESITGVNGQIIMPRSVKSKEKQGARTRNMAEVFTPTWICNKMNNLVDGAWFGKENVFNVEENTSWNACVEKIDFPNKSKTGIGSWMNYIAAKRLEITCGEAPYLVSRYDTVTGETIALEQRIGLLDRKLRVINEKVRNFKDVDRAKKRWLQLTKLALQSTYGFDWQGDNVLLARENLLYTIVDYYEAKFTEQLPTESLLELAKIIVWNIWQMDGIKCVIPDSCHDYKKQRKPMEPSLFDSKAFGATTLKRSVSLCDVNEDELQKCQGCLKDNVYLHNGIYCKVKNWSNGKIYKFKDLLSKQESGVDMSKDFKFDVVIGNPPYQVSDGGGVGSSALPVYQNFVMQAKEMLPNYIVMITPSRWFAGGRGLDAFRDNMLNDKRIRALHDYMDASKCFPGVEIKGGVCYFLWDREHNGNCKIITTDANGNVFASERPLLEDNMDTFLRYNEQISILRKVTSKNEKSFSELISANDPFGYDVRVAGSYKRVKPNYRLSKFDGALEFYYNGWRKEGVGYIEPDSVNKNKEFVDKIKVFIPKAWGSGNPTTDRLNPFVVGVNSVCTETYLCVGPFDDLNIANNVVSYIQTKFFHFMVFMKKITQNTMKYVYGVVPIQDFTKPWTDEELYQKYNLTEEEISFIENTIKPMD